LTDTPVSLRTVDLDNCAQEQIQIPGSIQPHGVLLAFNLAGELTHESRNARDWFERLPPLGQRPSHTELWSSRALREAAEGMLEDASVSEQVSPFSLEATVDGQAFDVVLHANRGRLLVEFEPRDADAAELGSFAVMAHRSMARMKNTPDIVSILREAVTAVRALTGFDRVLAYRFQSDDSGAIVAEARIDELDTYLGRRFPASDIPVQARRLYVINTLRLIADVHDGQVPIDALAPLEAPLDLSSSILRSVSPIHIEYLKNINVAASMSVSIVVAGRLWGLIACHHRSGHRVPYAVRMACDVLAQVVATSIQLVLARKADARRAAAADLRSALVELGANGEELPVGLGPSRAALAKVISSDRMLFAHGSDLRHEGIEADAAIELVRWLDAQPQELVATSDLAVLPQPLRDRLAPLTGMLAMQHDKINRGWMVFLRREQTATVTWSGPPDKVQRIGPLGARLTPDGSLAEWQQDVRGSAVPWDELDLSLARQIMDEVKRATASRAAEMERARTHLLAILGHDLRGPLQTIAMAAHLLEAGKDQAKLGRRITTTSGRMGRLIAQVLDMSRLHGGLGLGLLLVRTDLVALIADIVEETAIAHPNASIELRSVSALEADVDRDRLSQVITNLVGNARQHGALGEPVVIDLRSAADRAVIEVRNVAGPIPEAVRHSLFEPLRRGSLPNQRNPNGLGLGLYIASEAMKGHRGDIAYSHDGGNVSFTVTFPLKGLQAPANASHATADEPVTAAASSRPGAVEAG
jgi:light-regulated signal transduction histidine kinase (bacteriophytochrome)